MKPRITNTAAQSPMEHLAAAATLGTSSSIEAAESHGQVELVHSDQLPYDNRDRDVMESWGIAFGEQCEGDPLFVEATLPDGWTKEASDHAMWSYLIDDQGRRRAGIFYKAAFYDRGAHISAERRFKVQQDYDYEPRLAELRFQVLCDGRELYSQTKPYEGEKYGDDWRLAEKSLQEECQSWLEDRYPLHADKVKAWDIDVDFPTES